MEIKRSSLRVSLIEKEEATAFTTLGKVFITRGLVNLLSEDELEAIIEHEYAHKELRHSSRFLTVEFGLITLFIFTVFTHPLFIPAVFVAFTLLLAFISRSHEFEADKAAFKVYGPSFIDALKKLNHPSESIFSTHPPLEKRIKALQLNQEHF